jgi:aryl-alcohol dehydrogenase-like predicted oxidoreductase
VAAVVGTQRPWIVPIPGSRRLHRLEENVGAADLQLTADDLADIDVAARPRSPSMVAAIRSRCSE